MNRELFRQLAIVLALVLALSSGGLGQTSAQAPTDFAAGEILVKFQPGTPANAIAEAHRQNGGQVQEIIPGINVQVVRVPVGHETDRVAAYARNPNVLFAEVNGLYYAVWVLNDPRVGEQWQYNNTGQTGGTSDADIDAFEAWDVITGTSTVAIAILDSGIDQSHEDLKSKIEKNVNFTTSRTVDDKYGHGTHVAGSAAAITNNSLGVAGTCPDCVLYNVKVLSDSGIGFTSWIAKGIIWAADNGARVINMSLGGGGSSTLESAVNYAWGKGVVLAAAAGNSGTSDPLYPAFYDNVIAVAATDHNDAKASFSNYGAWVDVAAPGVNILSTAPDHRNRIWGSGVKYAMGSGTSMATPHVAGVAGLVWSTSLCSTVDPNDNEAICVRSRIEDKADGISGTGTYWTKGRINAHKAVSAP
jgi:thermitase